MAKKTELTPRKQPRQARSQATLDAIMEAAAQVLERAEREEQADASSQAIADRAGVSIGSIYQYFPTKKALIQAVIRHHLTKQMRLIESLIASVAGLPAEDAAARLVAGLVGDKRARSGFERSMIRYFCEVGDLQALTQLDDDMVRQVRAFLDGLGAQIRPVNTEVAAFVIAHALRSAVLLSLMQKPEQLEDGALQRELTELVIRYLRPDAPAG